MATYKSLISQVITDFNNIQTSLYNKGVTGVKAPSNTDSTSLIATSELYNYVKKYLVHPTGDHTITTSGYTTVATEVTENGNRTGYNRVYVTPGVFSDLSSAEQTDGTLLVSSGITTVGWFAEDKRTLSVPKATFTVSGGSVKTTSAGYIKNNETVGTLSQAVYNNPENSLSSITEQSMDVTNAIDIKSRAAVSTSRPSGKKYVYKFNYEGSATSTVKTPGYSGVAGTASGTATIKGDAYVTIDPAEFQSSNVTSDVSVSTSGDTKGVGAQLISSTGSTTAPTSGAYIEVIASEAAAGSVSVKTSGYADTAGTDATPVSMTPKTKYYTITEAVLKNTATDNREYTDITTDATVLVSGGYLYIDHGYISDSRISLAHLVPDFENVLEMNSTNSKFMLQNYKAYDEAGNVITGSMGTWTPATKYFTADSTNGVAAAVITKELYTGTSTYYVKSGTATAPAKIEGTQATVNVSSGTVTLTKTVSVTPVINANGGWIDQGTATNSAVTLTGTITTTSLAKGEGYCTITSATTSPTASGNYAKLDSSATSYVKVGAKGSGKVTVGTGYINEGSEVSNQSTETFARIAATINGSTSIIATGSKTIGTISTFTTTSGTTSVTSGSKKTEPISVSGKNETDSTFKDTYVVGNITVTASGTATATIDKDATGEDVDTALIALCNRLAGSAYTDVVA